LSEKIDAGRDAAAVVFRMFARAKDIAGRTV
jgi:hypothetical protein